MKKLSVFSIALFLLFQTPAFAEDGRQVQDSAAPEATAELEIRSELAELSYRALKAYGNREKSNALVEDASTHLIADEIVDHLHRGLSTEDMTAEQFDDYMSDVSTLSSALWMATEDLGGLQRALKSDDLSPAQCVTRCRNELIDCFAVLAPEEGFTSLLCPAIWEICLLDCISPF